MGGGSSYFITGVGTHLKHCTIMVLVVIQLYTHGPKLLLYRNKKKLESSFVLASSRPSVSCAQRGIQLVGHSEAFSQLGAARRSVS